MKNKIIKLLLSNLTNRKNAPYLINYIARINGINLLLHAYRNMGIHNATDELSGEKNFLFLLREKLVKMDPPVMFDVGANVGNYSRWLSEIFPKAHIHAFEPGSTTFQKLKENLKGAKNVLCNQNGLGAKERMETLYNPSSSHSSPHATFHKEVLTDLLSSGDLSEERVKMLTIDSYCQKHNIDKIDFLKIDTEGHELEVLKGAPQMISEGRIKAIQFEFNEMNIVSRVFLKDFYHYLPGYHFYRLNTKGLIKLGNYNSFNEIFQFQNIVALRNEDLNLA